MSTKAILLPTEPNIGISAGGVKTIEGLERALRAPVSEITMGSFTVNKRGGNTGSPYFSSKEYSLNAMGLPNCGLIEMRTMLKEAGSRCRASGKKLRVSITDEDIGGWQMLARDAFFEPAHIVELNFGCPNVWDGGKQKGILSFYPKAIDEVLGSLERYGSLSRNFAVKVSPYSNPADIPRVAEVLIAYQHLIREVVTMNTFPNSLSFCEKGQPVIKTPHGNFGGLSGRAVHEMALGQVAQWRSALPDSIDVVGVGGVNTGQALRNMFLAGASKVQVGSAYFEKEDPGVFRNILEEYAEHCAVA